jgi:hypothetical protein
MEILDVPEVRQLPELSANEEDPVAFADMVLTSLLGYDSALLYAEQQGTDSAVSWRIEPRNKAAPTHDIEVGVSPGRGSFRRPASWFRTCSLESKGYGACVCPSTAAVAHPKC